jgi:hypothetical protein
MKNIIIEIRKPLFGTYVYVRDIYIERAIKRKVNLEIHIPQGIGICDPIRWKNEGKRMEKVFKRPDEPMVLYGNYVKIDQPKTEDEQLQELSKESL